MKKDVLQNTKGDCHSYRGSLLGLSPHFTLIAFQVNTWHDFGGTLRAFPIMFEK